MSDQTLRDALTVPWRTGRHVGRTIYAQTGTEPTRSDVLIGTLDTPELAQAAVDAHNAALVEVTTYGDSGEPVYLDTSTTWRFEALVDRVLAQTVYPEPHVTALIDAARRARAERDDLAARIGAAQAIDPHMRGRWPRKGAHELRARDSGWNDAIAAVRRALQGGDGNAS